MGNFETNTKIVQVAGAFGISNVKNIEVCHIGHINGTFFADSDAGRIVVQRINKKIFTDPPALMDNIAAVTSHIRAKMESEGLPENEIARSVLRFSQTGEGKHYHIDNDGEYWRICGFINNTRTYNSGTPELLVQSGESFGRFQRYLSDFPARTLSETIPNFHHTAKRFEHFVQSVKDDAFGRAAKCRDLIDVVLSHEADTRRIVDLLESGELPLRVTHNDTKINNVLIDLDTGKGVCVVDLDTVMPSTLLYDFGDAIRSGASAVPEGSLDFDGFVVREDSYKAFYEGFIRGAGGSLTETELENLPLGSFMMTFEVGMRFLDDYLSGDTYFHTDYEGQNLDRSRGQLLLAEDIMRKRDRLLTIAR